MRTITYLKVGKDILERLLYPASFEFSNTSYSQNGEDMVLKRIFASKRKGFYVDVGACHPFQFSNTNYFYRRGWSGINIDTMPSSMKLFNKYRPRDVNLELAISEKKESKVYRVFKHERALNSCCDDVVRQYVEGGYMVECEKKVQTYTLAEVLDEHLESGRQIDFLSIDVEGMDYQVLMSNNWTKYRPTIVMVEELQMKTNETVQSEAMKNFMMERGYCVSCKIFNTLMFMNVGDSERIVV